ncbi:CHAP domain-containing protein [Planomonospora sp. ID67723]|uniref:CHAP domain-containing protein n=1 Tax=Planomonospora sp. ID67723 TaxID=2738134 RepID=UPI0018C3AAEE|nr:CHAP domain-containing protein [Planomonospora sp. ID67723]MBG0832809.1 CHAP domain-containing protein [Planomonospora sp. ID67723]
MTEHRVPCPLLPSHLARAAAGVALAVCAIPVGAPAFLPDGSGEAAVAPSRPGDPAASAGKPFRTAVMTTADVLRVAETQIGVTENSSGGGTKFHAWYMASQRAQETLARDGGVMAKYTDAPWCAMFVSWVGEQVGLRSTFGADAYAVAWAGWFQDNGRWGEAARPGAVVYFDLDADDDDGIYKIDHVGLVKRDNGDGTITTVEGNTDNGRVERRVRPVSDVIGYGYPQYPAAEGPRPAVQAARAEASR